MITLRTGIKTGVRPGLAVGLAADEISVGGVTADTDATSGKYVPSSAAQFTALGLTAPGSLWLMQEASGNLADTIGTLTLTAAAAPLYQTAVTGWSRKGVTTVDGTAGQRFSTTAGPDAGTTSHLMVLYMITRTTPAAVRGMAAFGTTFIESRLTVTPRARITVAGVSADGAATPNGQVRPWVLRFDRTNSNATLYTDAEKLVGTYSATITGALVRIGATSSAPADADFLWGCLYTGAAAEMSDATVKTMLQTLGWTVPWT